MTPAECFCFNVKSKAQVLSRDPHEVLDDILEALTHHELATMFHAWREFWARPEQVFPRTFKSRTFLGARRSGKTRAVCEWVQEEVQAYPRAEIILLAQNEDKAIDVLVKGQSGLLATAPPWNAATWEPSTLTVYWANGAKAKVLTPGEPQNIRGDGWTHAVFTELQSWPRHTREEAFMNMFIATSAVPAKIAGDCTPPKHGRHPLLDELIAEAAAEPEEYIVVHAKIEDNANNLAPGHVQTLRRKVVGAAAKAELDGIYDPTAVGALFDQEWIDDARCVMPDKLVRRVIAIDPAISVEESSDATGIIEAGLARNDQILVLDDMTGKHRWSSWGALVLDRYVAHECDLIIIELNRGRDACIANLEAAAKDRKLRIEVIKSDKRPPRREGVVHVLGVTGRGPKADRAGPVATLYEKGKVSHVRGATLTALETLLTGWVPPVEGTRGGARRSPDAMDALVMAVVELAGLGSTQVRHPTAGLSDVAKRLMPPAPGGIGDLRSRFRRDQWGRAV